MIFPDVIPEVAGPPPILDPEHYEIINGERVETPCMGSYETWVANILNQAIGPFARVNRLGRCVTEMMFALGPDGNKRRPDLAFVSFDRWPRTRRVPPGEAWPIVPDLAVEVVSPSNTASEIVTKTQEYFRAGARLVWVVYPEVQMVQIWTDAATCHALHVGDDLDGGAVVPGFRLPLAELFEVDLP